MPDEVAVQLKADHDGASSANFVNHDLFPTVSRVISAVARLIAVHSGLVVLAGVKDAVTAG